MYWRVGEQRRSRLAADIDEAIAEGRAAADRLLTGSEPEGDQFDQR